MKLLPILFAVLLILPVAFPLQPVPVFPTPVASAIFDDFSGFLSGIAHWLGFAPANAKEGCLIEAVASPSEGGRADGSGAYACSTTVRLSAYPAFGYELVNFTAQGCQLVAATGQNAVVTTGSFGSCRITAIFDKPSAKNAQLPKKESVTVTEIPA
ncbi:MAG: hypothetical protein NTV88_02010, partial [Candidatus Micrarchaeota archaeon]|nr:hypothetical protein [Candidatus Micrarchaeota archaeon]